MIRKILFILFVLFASGGVYAQNGAIKGKVLDASTGEAIPFANIVVEQNGNMIGGGVSDFDGNYTIKPVPAGRFTVKSSYVGYNTLQINDVVVYNDKIRFLDLQMNISSQAIEELDVVAYTVPLIDKDNTSTGGTVTAEEITKMAGRSPESVAATVGGVYQEDGQVKSVRGARENATVYFIDGVKVRGGNNVPKSAIAEVSVITGGTPAKYGDATGGIISIITKGASRTYFGGFEFATSKFLDPYNSNILGANLSGPILTRKIVDADNPDIIREEPLLGFFVAGEYQFADDPRPSAVGFWKPKDDILDSIKRTPLVRFGGAEAGIPTASFLQADDFENVSVRPNTKRKRLMLSGKIDFQPVKNLVFTLGGNLENVGWNTGRDAYYENHKSGQQILGYENNRQNLTTDYRIYGRLTHRLGSQNAENESNSIIKNAYYTVQVDYSKNLLTRQSERHKSNLFDYGYVGKFNTYKIPTYAYGYDTTLNMSGYLMEAFKDTLVTFDPSNTTNPELSRYTEMYYGLFGNPLNTSEILKGGGFLNGNDINTIPQIHGIYDLPGLPYNYYVKQDNDMFRVNASGAADINNHEISLGFEFEKRTDRFYRVDASSLWLLAQQNINSHISEIDFTNPHMGYVKDENGDYVKDENGDYIFNDTITYDRAYNGNGQTLFDIRFRESQGIDVSGTDWVDVDSYDPDQLSIEYFSADELYNNSDSKVVYYGFDAYGNKISNKPTFEEFFTKTFTDASTGRKFRSRQIAPFEPIYMAGYIQDKFAFNDLVFNVGVRIDRYDANQKVQEDPFLIYTAYKVKDAAEETSNNGKNIIGGTNIPANINRDATVYVDNRDDANEIVGYRYESQWYDASGNEINDPQLIYRNGAIQPYLKNPNEKVGGKTFLDAFTDYTPDIAILPRISFSFPISDEALFFAHYDILTKRPRGSVSQLDPIYYLFIEQYGSRYFNNPALKPEKTTSYEFGFQQKLNNKSSIKLSAFYNEQRDMVQVVSRVGAYPIDMRTYGNIDFGTIKGFTMMYDLRRTGNVSLKASYTLQFANATGSDEFTGRSIINSGQPNLRAALPTSFDQRHALSILLDYRFGSGKNYNGPKWFGSDVLADAGANFIIYSGSGTPYTKRDVNSNKVIGSVNGSVKPWRTSVDMKVDKSFFIKMGKAENSKMGELNAYLEISNLFDAKNILNVYETTGNADDDAFLNSRTGQSNIKNAYDANSYMSYYQMYLNNPSFYSLPRQIRLGVLFSF